MRGCVFMVITVGWSINTHILTSELNLLERTYLSCVQTCTSDPNPCSLPIAFHFSKHLFYVIKDMPWICPRASTIHILWVSIREHHCRKKFQCLSNVKVITYTFQHSFDKCFLVSPCLAANKDLSKLTINLGKI